MWSVKKFSLPLRLKIQNLSEKAICKKDTQSLICIALYLHLINVYIFINHVSLHFTENLNEYWLLKNTTQLKTFLHISLWERKPNLRFKCTYLKHLSNLFMVASSYENWGPNFIFLIKHLINTKFIGRN